ncbi:helix-turn-helix domain-containing protein [Mycobacterium sp. NPDC050041]|uniref:helix-turn-helix domain-containing protein n=1 Tax=Mycobacterium sp. NPDC050041 TaxID=3364293 RepID=UPI003C2CCEAB
MITAQAGVFITADDAAYIAEALRLLGRLMAEQRSQPSARLQSVTTKLANAAETGSGATPNGSETLPLRAPHPEGVHARDYATVTAAEAARIIGCGPRNVRDLVRRGRLAARRSGGTWLVDAAAVEAHAARKACRGG